jgi:uncharacterized spore protein YtfJ
MNINDLLSQVRNFLSHSAGAEISFGNPVKVGDVSIVTVARVGFGFGGGGGNSPVTRKNCKKEDVEASTSDSEDTAQNAEDSAPETNTANYGGGGGGGMKTDPVGIYTINGDKVKFYPVISIKEMLTAFGILSFLIIRVVRSRRKGKK